MMPRDGSCSLFESKGVMESEIWHQRRSGIGLSLYKRNLELITNGILIQTELGIKNKLKSRANGMNIKRN